VRVTRAVGRDVAEVHDQACRVASIQRATTVQLSPNAAARGVRCVSETRTILMPWMLPRARAPIEKRGENFTRA
jgi:hypothetical protein